MTESLNDAAMPMMTPSPGALIKAGRERAGVHMAVLSVNLKVTVKQLEALEADQYEFLSGTVFARALAAKVCRFVKMDPVPVLALMPATANGLKPLNIIGADQAPSYQSNYNSTRTGIMGHGLKLWLLILFLCLLALVFGSSWMVSVLHLEGQTQSSEVVPTMPPLQEPAANDAAQADLPKAMVFDIANSTPAAAPVAMPTSTTPSATSSNAPAETHK